LLEASQHKEFPRRVLPAGSVFLRVVPEITPNNHSNLDALATQIVAIEENQGLVTHTPYCPFSALFGDKIYWSETCII
jgi:hypothetical protein